MSLREAWETNAEAWIRWARTPGHDVYDRFHAARFLEVVPSPGRLTVDLGAGEGRLGRDLTRFGHRVIAIDASPTLAAACATHEVPLSTVLADAIALPLRSGCADLVVAFMSFQDIDDLQAAAGEAARLLSAQGCLCVAIVHPLNSAGRFITRESMAPFVVSGSYLATFRYHDEVDNGGLRMDFHSEHRPLEAYSRALEGAGFVIEAIREPSVPDPADRWSRVPLFMHIRARRP